MLEVKNLTKIYKTKGGAQVNAIDDVSVRFPEKGMVFLLGKSGSGKSTLLNVAGGLDSPTSGEIVVKGRSSKQFSQSDFDSYRNTFIGFIFQEYNILNEFTVEDNIALALELQGKPKDKKAIAALLEQVDLSGYGKRKPNTLSGGQKQRIAIARALIKNPEIIMADEPTGALDSATGKQVFDTLKKLSEEKLVIIVSHDREFAELYGDRIIELKDGKILSDVSKVNEPQVKFSENLTVVGEHTVCVKKGADLTEKDFEYIKYFLKKTDGDVMFTGGEREIKEFKKASRITENGEKETFKNTDENKSERKAYTPEDGRFIRSKLPARHALKIGVSGLKSKPVRLLFTVLLCTVAFVMFGLLSTLTFYNAKATFKQTLKDSDYQFLRIQKEYREHYDVYNGGTLDYSYYNDHDGRFTKAEAEEYAKTYGEESFGAVAANGQIPVQNANERYWSPQISYFAYLPQTHSLLNGLKGRYPQANDEICISSYTANVIVHCKLYDRNKGEAIEFQNVDELLSQTNPVKLELNHKTYKIVGIFDSGEIPAKYDAIKNGESVGWSTENKFENELSDGSYKLALLTENAVEEAASKGGREEYRTYERRLSYATQTKDGNDFETNNQVYYDPYKQNGETAFFGNKTSLSAGEATVSLQFFYSLVESLISEKWNEVQNAYWDAQQAYDIFVGDPPEGYDGSQFDLWRQGEAPEENAPEYPTYLEWKELYDEKCRAAEIESFYRSYTDSLRDMIWVLCYGRYDSEKGETVTLTKAERELYAEKILAWVEEENASLTFSVKILVEDVLHGEEKTFTVVGISDLYAEERQNDTMAYFTETEYSELWNEQKTHLTYYTESHTAYTEQADAFYQTVFVSYDKSDAATENIYKLSQSGKFDENDTRINISNAVVSSLEMVDGTVSSMEKAFLYVGLVIALFAALLLCNFISVSISYKKKEIGILRAVGARSLDVFKIFFSESLVIAALCIVLSLVGSTFVCNLLNAELGEGLGVSLLVFGPASVGVLIGLALLTAFLATFLPVYSAAKKKPVDSIRAL